ncbi:SDR family NAD(P)-dependent oxidoreductase [Flexivirga aerilata]|uniref:SDR family NAD(P)-dependent oxidoreductase n=1 Tax=Flexivirga aerilata TaxID=1656889 RepID=UPI001FEB2F90|nr:SDR family NAD(P)-dependent oxidoreductase [Flexivirga aerilata]
MAAAGHHVVIGARNGATAQCIADDLVKQGHSATAVQLDVTDESQVVAAAERIRQAHGRLDVLVNNAGILPEARGDAAEIVDARLFRETFETNVFGAVAVTESCMPLLRASEGARIVNVSTTMGSLTDQTDPSSPYYALTMPAYQASKAALNNVTIALAKQLAQTPIRVTSVCPGFVQTDLTPMNRSQAPLTAAEAAEVVIRAATLPANAKSGTFIDADGVVPW